MKKATAVLLGFIIAKMALQYFLVHPSYDLHRDEYLHLDQGMHPAWGYISVPPVTSWISFVIKALGNGVFWVKFFPALFGALTIAIVWKLVETIGGGLFACILASLSLLLSVLLRINMLYQPNSLDILFWTLSYFCVVKLIATGRTQWFYALGISAAFGFLSKYNIAFLFLGLLPALILSRHRKIFLNRHLYFAGALAFLIILLNLCWQYSNDFPTARQLKELAETQLVNVRTPDFLREQVLFFFNSFFVVLLGLAGLALHVPFRPYRVILFSVVVSIVVFIMLSAKSYYAIGLYPVLIGFGAVYGERLSLRRWKRPVRAASLLLIVGLFLLAVKLLFPLQPPEVLKKNNAQFAAAGMLRWEDGKNHHLPQDFADMTGWKELARKVDSTYALLPPASNTLVLCDNYGQAGAINYYTRRDIRAVSFNADYIDWIPLGRPIENVILVKDLPDPDPMRTEERPLFDSVRRTGTIENDCAREFGTGIFLLSGARADINRRILEEIIEKKRKP